MIEFTIQTEVERPPPEVFAFATDPERLPEWQTNTVSAVPLEDGPLRVGSRLREVHRGPGGKELESLVEVSELDPDRRFGLKMIEGPLPVDGRLRFEPKGAGTRIAFTVQARPSGAMRLAQPLLRLALKRQFKQHCAELKRALESRASAPSP
jgi:uncharacterized protein YndB with AHSA1/START domain